MKKVELPIEEIVKKYESGMTGVQIAEEYGVSYRTIYRRLTEYYKNNGVSKDTIKNRHYKESQPNYLKKIELSIEEIVEKYERGMTEIQISEEYSVSKNLIWRRLAEYYKNAGTSKPKHNGGGRKKIELLIEEIVKKYESGMTEIQIAEEYGVSKSTISNRLIEYYNESQCLQKKDHRKKVDSSNIKETTAKERKKIKNIKTIIELFKQGYTEDQIYELAEKAHKYIPNDIMQKAIEEYGYTTVKQQKDEINIGKYKLVRTLGNEKMKKMILKLIKTRNATDEQIQKIAEFYGVEMDRIENINEER